MCETFHTDAITYLSAIPSTIQKGEFLLTFLDPPFNQGKEYAVFDDNPPQRGLGVMCTGTRTMTRFPTITTTPGRSWA